MSIATHHLKEHAAKLALTLFLALATTFARGQQKIFLANDYGAKGDGTTLNTIAIQKAIDEAAKTRLLAIAERCPVHLTLTKGSDVQTTIVQAPMAAHATTQCEHKAAMDEACAD